MTTSQFFMGRAIGFIILLLLVGGFFAIKHAAKAPEVPAVAQDVRGCYVAAIQKDVYTLTVDTQDGENFAGTLQFKNFEKDSSSGTYVGTYKGGILSGNYDFQSEGTQSVMNVQFERSGDDFVRGVEEDAGMVFDKTDEGGVFKKVACQ